MAIRWQSLSKTTVAIISTLIQGYRYCISPLLGATCRFYPTCSQYALDALHAHGSIRGLLLTIKRLLKCHPLCAGGFDPVPQQLKTIQHHG